MEGLGITEQLGQHVLASDIRLVWNVLLAFLQQPSPSLKEGLIDTKGRLRLDPRFFALR